MRGPALFTGYWGEPQQTTDSFGAAGFLMTGDLVVRTEEGFVKVVGRVKDFIIRGGTNIDPVEIEELLRGHPAVRDVRSEEHTSELQSLMRISYAVFCLKKTKCRIKQTHTK